MQDDHKVMVNVQCLVKFKIGSYQDEVLCDVILMDICHMLLVGRGSLIGMLYMMGMQIPTL